MNHNPKKIKLKKIKIINMSSHYSSLNKLFIEGNLEVKLPTMLTEKQRTAEAERRERLEKRSVEEKESEERKYR